MCKAITSPPKRSKIAKKHRRRVTFAKGASDIEVGVTIKTIPSTANMTLEDRRTMHFTKADKLRTRKEARDVAEEVSDSKYGPTILGAFASCHNSNPSTPPLAYLNDTDFRQLATQLPLHCRGLERLCVSPLNSSIVSLKRRAVRTVVDLYGTAMANHGYLSTIAQREIAEIYRKESEQSKRFAALMGRVDAIDSTTPTPATPEVKSLSARDSPVTVVMDLDSLVTTSDGSAPVATTA